MKAFLDTSVLIAAFWNDHPGHAESLQVLRKASPDETSCSLHTLAEVFATLTAMPSRDSVSPDEVMLFIGDIRKHCATVLLHEQEYIATIEAASHKGFSSGMIYDALLLRCAEKVQAQTIYTWNLKHFRRIAPELSNRIRTP